MKAAEATSRDRAMAAGLAGRADWQATQLIAAANYATESASILNRLVRIQPLLESLTRSLVPSQPEAISNYLQVNGLPALLVRTLSEYGWSGGEIEALRANLIQLGSGALGHPELEAADLRLLALESESTGMRDLTRGVQIRVDQLGFNVRGLTQSERQELDTLRAGIETGLAGRVFSSGLLLTALS